MSYNINCNNHQPKGFVQSILNIATRFDAQGFVKRAEIDENQDQGNFSKSLRIRASELMTSFTEWMLGCGVDASSTINVSEEIEFQEISELIERRYNDTIHNKASREDCVWQFYCIIGQYCKTIPKATLELMERLYTRYPNDAALRQRACMLHFDSIIEAYYKKEGLKPVVLELERLYNDYPNDEVLRRVCVNQLSFMIRRFKKLDLKSLHELIFSLCLMPLSNHHAVTLFCYIKAHLLSDPDKAEIVKNVALDAARYAQDTPAWP